MMKYRKPTMELFWLDVEDIIKTSQIEFDPNKPFPDIEEDGEDW